MQQLALALQRTKNEHVCCNAGLPGPPSKTATRSKWLAVAMFCLVAALLNADQNLMAPVLSDIAADFGFDARQVPCVLQAYCLCCVSSGVCFCSSSAHSRQCCTCPKTCCAPCSRQRDVYLGGWVSAAFFLVGAPAALLVGYISDRVNRKHLLLWVVLLGEWDLCHGHCMCCGGEAASMKLGAAPCSVPCARTAQIGAATIH